MFHLLLVLCWLMTVEGQSDEPIMCLNGTTLFPVDSVCKSRTGNIYIFSRDLVLFIFQVSFNYEIHVFSRNSVLFPLPYKSLSLKNLAKR